ncbi:GNAT family N-acetyltransferase [Pararhizobium mangrovi]|uniref:GNAT family N-acetyltransferase n=1 Tax=Pararhizobium mangrovi TaxID=2590452 RepID=A0A506U8P6_9HYPH|nr:GNAT family N-acetyltransferase [Pararhizobium mangrovi]TPW30723.1 GNAT family N-acetyltransferase [Pararhizobium mangrovi]
MTDDLRIRPLDAADEAEWRRLWTGYLAFYESEVAEDIYAETFRRITGDDGPFEPCGLIAERNGEAVGLVHYLFHRHCWRCENVCYLQDLYCDPQARGTGVGRALIEAVYARADAEGAPSVYWLTQDFNHRARKLYDRIGEATPFVKYQRPR